MPSILAGVPVRGAGVCDGVEVEIAGAATVGGAGVDDGVGVEAVGAAAMGCAGGRSSFGFLSEKTMPTKMLCSRTASLTFSATSSLLASACAFIVVCDIAMAAWYAAAAALMLVTLDMSSMFESGVSFDAIVVDYFRGIYMSLQCLHLFHYRW